MTKLNWLLSLSTCAVMLFSTGCKKDGGGINLFTIEQDKQFGQQLEQEIASNPSEFPVLSYTGNETAYNYLYEMRDAILASDEVRYRDEFEWNLYIINDDNTLNAFCAPGGYIYVYTGLINYLSEADHLAGVIGHEIAHADQRHSTQQMTEAYGIDLLLGILAGGNSSQLSEIASGLASLGFSRADEKDADDHSVDYLCDTDYAANGAAAFFEQLIADGNAGGTPAFLSTHPNPDNRVESINDRATEAGCSTTLKPDAGYAAFVASLP